MNIKIILLLFTLFLTGCTVNYDLEFQSNKIIENINGKIEKSKAESIVNDTSVNIYYDFIYNDTFALIEGDDLYKKNTLIDGDYINYDLEYIYKKNFDKSRIINNCFESHIVEETSDYLYVNLSGKFTCLYSDEITVNVTSDYAVIENNADRINKNKYTWLLTDEDNEEIVFSVSKNVKQISDDGESKPNYFRIIGFIVLVVLSFITYFLYKKKNSGKI